MPKVTAQYLAEKKKEIVAAAMRVCVAKPAYEITLRDVVRECGISTGGIYNYFSSVDDIFVEILNQAYAEFPYADELIKIFESKRPVAEIVVEAFKHEGRLIDSMYGRYGKFMMELDVILLNDPERGRHMISQSKGNNENNIFLAKLFAFINTSIAEGALNPIVPVPHILFTVIGATEGVRKFATAKEYVKESLMMLGLTETECANAEGLMEILARVLLKMLNAKI